MILFSYDNHLIHVSGEEIKFTIKMQFILLKKERIFPPYYFLFITYNPFNSNIIQK